jgi:hypothetical protein
LYPNHISRTGCDISSQNFGVPMAIKLGPAIFDDHISIEIIPNKWTDTFIFPVRHDWALPPWNYAEVVKTVIRTLRKWRKSPSLWVPVMAPGNWYFSEMKYALREASIPVAVTRGRAVPQVLDFSKPPGIYDTPCLAAEPTDLLPVSSLTENALRGLLLIARLTVAYTNEVECGLLLGEVASRNALRKLVKLGYIEYHPNDGNINAHLLETKPRPVTRNGQGMKWNGDFWPYWKIRRPGVSAALRVWGVPAGTRFDYRLERTRLLNSHHRRRSRQWPKWVSLALPHAEVFAGWNEVSIPGLRARPDALAWGKIHGVETLFWLEVESGRFSRKRMLEKTTVRWLKAKGYADAADIHLIFVLLGMPWVREAVRTALTDVPRNCAVIISSWHRLNFGKLPYPKWGEAVVE